MAKNTTTRTPAPATPAPAATPTSAKPKPAPANCRCGCGAPTVRPEAAYLPGHDARHAGQVGRRLIAEFGSRGSLQDEQVAELVAGLPTSALQDKARGMLRTHVGKATRKAASAEARKAAQAAAKAAYAAALAEAGL